MSPYSNIPRENWNKVTENLVNNHPLKPFIVNFCFQTWASILNGHINSYLNLKIEQMNLSPQAISNLFHDILPLYIVKNSINWKKGSGANEKDLVHTVHDYYSFEIKISTSQNSIFGNRSYGQTSINSKKSKDGYYLAINIPKSVQKSSINKATPYGIIY